MGIDIDGRYYEESVRSENGQFTLALSDASPDGLLGGARDKGLGGYALLSWNKVIVKGSMERPNDGKVSNQGNFIINDWMFSGASEGTFYAFDAQGNVLVSQKYRANLGPNGISPDGRYAVCQVFSSDNRDSNTVSFFNLDQRKLLWKKEPSSGPADGFRFDVNNAVLFLQYQDGREFRYNFDGTFLDSDRLMKEEIETANGYELYDLALDKLGELDPDKKDFSLFDEPISLLKRALDKGLSSYYQGLAHRELGEIFLERGERVQAIFHFEKAIAANPKIGVKKVLAKLKTED
jgi:tetratricopeptide (TPR) repeat protein